MKVPRAALRAPLVWMQGVVDEAMPSIVEEAQRSRRADAARNPKGARALGPLDGVARRRRCPASHSSSCLAREPKSLTRDAVRLSLRTPRVR